MVRFESEVDRLTDLRDRRAISEREYEQGIADRDAQAQAVTRFESEAARLAELIAHSGRLVTIFDRASQSPIHLQRAKWNLIEDSVTVVNVSATGVSE